MTGSTAAPPAAPTPPTFRQAFVYWLRLGFISFGGLVERKRSISEQRYLHVLKNGWLWGIAAACVVTFFTFLPSFCFIFLGAPFIESTHGKLKFTAPLTGITAAVVGVIPVVLAAGLAGLGWQLLH